jgi:hypothetical protein
MPMMERREESLIKRSELTGQGREDLADGLGEDDVAIGLDGGEADGAGAIELRFADAFDAGADDFRDVSAGEGGKGKDADDVAVLDAEGCGDEVEEDDELDEQRGAADNLDVNAGKVAERKERGAAEKGQDDADEGTGDEGDGGEEEGDQPASQEEGAIGPDAAPIPVIADCGEGEGEDAGDECEGEEEAGGFAPKGRAGRHHGMQTEDGGRGKDGRLGGRGLWVLTDLWG